MAVDTLGQLLAVVVTPANEPERAQVAAHCAEPAEALAEPVQAVTGESVEAAPEPACAERAEASKRGVRRPGRYGGTTGGRRPRPRHPAGGRQTVGSQTRLRAALRRAHGAAAAPPGR